jgi:hypothetical protein
MLDDGQDKWNNLEYFKRFHEIKPTAKKVNKSTVPHLWHQCDAHNCDVIFIPSEHQGRLHRYCSKKCRDKSEKRRKRADMKARAER